MSAVFRFSTYFGATLALLFSVHAHSASAALLYIDPVETGVHRGDTVTMSVRLDVDPEECINTVDAVIHYDASVRAVDVSRGDSILSLWVESPVIDAENKTISFAGGIPGGYCGRIPGDPGLTNTILKLIFRSPGLSVGGGDASDIARVWFGDETQVLLHDGYGTPAPLLVQDARILLEKTPGDTPTDAWTGEIQSDTQLPSDFTIELSKDEFAFNGKYFITFNSVDKQSGISHYEVMEEPFSEFYSFTWGRADAPWIRTESPYVLEDQTLNSTIRVKAIDKAGNERIATFVPDAAQRSLSHDRLIAIALTVVGLLLVVGLVTFALWKRRNRILTQAEDDESD